MIIWSNVPPPPHSAPRSGGLEAQTDYEGQNVEILERELGVYISTRVVGIHPEYTALRRFDHHGAECRKRLKITLRGDFLWDLVVFRKIHFTMEWCKD